MSAKPVFKVNCHLSAFQLRCLISLIQSMSVADLPVDTRESVIIYTEIMNLKYYLQNQLEILNHDSVLFHQN